MADEIEHELCANCKKEIPQTNYVMHMAHCARNITLCPTCKEPIPKNKFEAHKKMHTGQTSRSSPHRAVAAVKTSVTTTSTVVKQQESKQTNIGGTYKKQSVAASPTTTVHPQNDYAKPSKDAMLACKYCELELPKLDLDDHESYCGTRTDKCNECGEFVMYRYKKLHEESNHGFIKLSDEPGPRASWDSNTQRTATSSSSSTTNGSDSLYSRRNRAPSLRSFDMSPMYNMVDYMPPSMSGRFAGENTRKTEKSETYKDLSRRLDCKTEYIKNLLHDSASITAPLRSAGTAPRNHFNHQKGPAPLPPPHRRRNPPTELTIPCEFCNTPIPHEDLIQHETGCRPDLARFNPRRRSPEPDDYFTAPAPSSPEVELPCEFCSDMFPASELLRHQLSCN